LTNNFALKTELIPVLCHQRWQLELFFKWIKQHLRIKTFYGTTVNLFKTQFWIAVCTNVLIAITKKCLHLPSSFHELLQILSFTMFDPPQKIQLITRPTTDSDQELEPQQLSRI